MDDMSLEALGARAAAEQLAPKAEPAPTANANGTAAPAAPEQPTATPPPEPAKLAGDQPEAPEIKEETTEQPPLAAPPEPPDDLGDVPWGDSMPDGARDVSDEEHAEAVSKIDELLKLDEDPEKNEKLWTAIRHTKQGRKFENHAKAMRNLVQKLGDDLSDETMDQYRMARNALDWSKQDVYKLTDPNDPGFAEGKQRFFDFWFGPAKDDPEARAGVERTLDYLPEALWKIEPQLYVRTRNGFLNEYVTALYSKADKMPEGDDKNKTLALAENLDYTLTGKYRGMGSAQPTNGAPHPPTNGYANGNGQSPEVLRQLDQLRRENQELRSGQAQSVTGAIESQIDQKLESVAQEALLANDGSRAWWESQPPFVQRSILQELRTGMKREVESDPHFMDRHKLELRESLRSADPQNAASRLVERYARSAAAVLRAKVWPEVARGLRKQSTDTQARTDARRDKLQAAQSATAPNGAGTPVPAAAAQPLRRGANESMDAFSERVATHHLAHA